MKRRLGVTLLVVGALLALTAAVACDGDNDTGGETTPAAAGSPDSTPDGTRDAIPGSTPGATPDTATDDLRTSVPQEPDEEPEATPDTATDDLDINYPPELDEELEATLRAEAEALCPDENDLERCVGAYILWATAQRETAMCVGDEGNWFFEPAQGSVGDACSAGKGDIVAIVGGE